MPCEFLGYTNCERRFGIGQIQPWLDHVIGFHLQGNLPRETVCWFCDNYTFVAPSNRDVDKEAALRQRMYHIVDHLRENPDGLRIRPDFPFLEHIERCGLIPQAVVDQARAYSEMPAEYRFRTDASPPRRPSQRHVVIENNRTDSRRRRRGVQRYNP